MRLKCGETLSIRFRNAPNSRIRNRRRGGGEIKVTNGNKGSEGIRSI